jgi:hypothetical protein
MGQASFGLDEVLLLLHEVDAWYGKQVPARGGESFDKHCLCFPASRRAF